MGRKGSQPAAFFVSKILESTKVDRGQNVTDGGEADNEAHWAIITILPNPFFYCVTGILLYPNLAARVGKKIS